MCIVSLPVFGIFQWFVVLEALLCLQRKKAKVDAAKEGNEAADSDDDDADDNAESD